MKMRNLAVAWNACLLGALAGCGTEPDSAADNYQLGIAWHEAGNPPEAVASLTRAIEANPQHADALYFRALNYQLQQEYDKALDDYDRALELQPQSARNLAGRAGLLITRGDYDRAAADADAAVRIDENYPDGHLFRAKVRLALGQPEGAIDDLNDYIRLAPEGENARRAYALLGDALRAQEKHADAVYNYNLAIQLYDETIRQNPKHEAVTKDKTKVWYGKEVYDEASQAYAGRATAHVARGNFDDAFRDGAKAIRLDEENLEAYMQHARAAKERDRYLLAIENYEQVIELAPESHAAYRELAWLQATTPLSEYRDGAAAVKNAQQACEYSDWKDSASLEALAAAYAELGDFKQATEHQRKAIELASGDSAAPQERLRLYQSQEPYRDHPRR